MSNLISEYGTSWFARKFFKTLFMYKDTPAFVEAVNSRNVEAMLLVKHKGDIKPLRRSLPHSFFTDSSIFKVPELGYRYADNGRWLMYLRRDNHSYVRGLSLNNLRPGRNLVSPLLRGVQGPRPEGVAYRALIPAFLPLHKGIKLMLSGHLLSFAASSTIAVVPNSNASGLNVLFCNKVVGNVDLNGNIDISVPFVETYMKERES